MYTMRVLRLVVAFLGLLAVQGAYAAQGRFLENLAEHLSQELFDGRQSGQGQEKYTFKCPVLGQCDHAVVGLFMDDFGRFTRAWVVRAIPNVPDCHACTSRISLQLHEQRGNVWRNVKAYARFAEWGRWGVVAPKDVRLARLADGRALLFLHRLQASQGTAEEMAAIYMERGGKLANVALLRVGFDDSEWFVDEPGRATRWKARFRLVVRDGQEVLEASIVDLPSGKLSFSHFLLGKNGLKPLGRVDPRLLPYE